MRAGIAQAPIEGGADVFAQRRVAIDPGLGCGHFPVVAGLLHQHQAARGMAFVGGVEFSRQGEFFQGVGAGDVQQAVHHFVLAGLHIQQGLGDQLRD